MPIASKSWPTGMARPSCRMCSAAPSELQATWPIRFIRMTAVMQSSPTRFTRCWRRWWKSSGPAAAPGPQAPREVPQAPAPLRRLLPCPGRGTWVHSAPPSSGWLFPQGDFMRHYEIVVLVHPDQSEQVPAMLERYKGMVTATGGSVHRVEDWGRRQLAFPITKVHKAHYILMNIETDQATLAELTGAFRFSDAVLRHLVVAMDEAVVEPSPMARGEEEEADRRRDRDDDGDDAGAR